MIELIQEPVVCPMCGLPLTRKRAVDVDVYCTNEECRGRNIEYLSFFVGKDAMDIDGISTKTITLLYDNKYITNWQDLYTFDYDTLLRDGVKGMEAKTINNIKDSVAKSISKSKGDRLLYSMGIPLIGYKTSVKILEFLGGDILNAEKPFDRLRFVDEIGNVAGNCFLEWIDNKSSVFFDFVKNFGKFDTSIETSVYGDGVFTGKNLIASGTFSNFSRDGIVEVIKQNGGNYLSSVSKKLDFFVCGENVGSSKIKKANDIGLCIINENEFINLINNKHE